MSKAKEQIKLSEQWDGDIFKGYRRFIHGKMFTLGKDELVARLKAGALEAAGRTLKSQNRQWTDEIIQQAIALALGQTQAAAPTTNAETSERSKANGSQPSSQETPAALTGKAAYMIHQAIDDFILSLDANFDQKEFGEEQRLSLTNRTAALKFAFGDEATLAFFDLPEDKQRLVENKPLYMHAPSLKNKPLNLVTENDLLIFKTFLVSRPISRKTGKPLKVQTVSNNLQGAGRFFTWAKKQKHWSGFEDWKELFKFNRNQKRNMMSAAEKTAKAAPKDHMTYDDLNFYWRASMDRMKMYQGLAFWCAWTQMEIATFRKVEFYMDYMGDYFIDKARSKTGEAGKWWIPEPVAKLVKRYMAQTPDDPSINPDGLAFLTENHNPVVHFGDDGRGKKCRSDLIANYLWKPIQYASKKSRNGRSHSFKWFRKTMPDMVGQMTANRFIAKAALAQAVNDVADVHYINPLTDQFIVAAKQLWQEKMQFIHVIKDQKNLTPAEKEEVEKAKQYVSTFLKTKHKAKVEEAAPA